MKQHPQILVYIRHHLRWLLWCVISRDHAGLSDEVNFDNNAAGDTDVADEFLHEVLTIATSDDNRDEWDEKFKIIMPRSQF